MLATMYTYILVIWSLSYQRALATHGTMQICSDLLFYIHIDINIADILGQKYRCRCYALLTDLRYGSITLRHLGICCWRKH